MVDIAQSNIVIPGLTETQSLNTLLFLHRVCAVDVGGCKSLILRQSILKHNQYERKRKPDGVRQRSATEYQNQLLENAENEFRTKCNKVYLELVESVRTDVQVQLNGLQKEYNEKMALLTRLQEESPDETLIDYERASLTVLKTNLEVLSDIASH